MAGSGAADLGSGPCGSLRGRCGPPRVERRVSIPDSRRPARDLRVVSGGQTGVDRAALDLARELHLPCGGWCPRGRRAEDGVVPARYRLRETPSTAYTQRTEWNVRDADATLILHRGPLQGGSALTARIARRLRHPLLRRRPGGGPPWFMTGCGPTLCACSTSPVRGRASDPGSTPRPGLSCCVRSPRGVAGPSARQEVPTPGRAVEQSFGAVGLSLAAGRRTRVADSINPR